MYTIFRVIYNLLVGLATPFLLLRLLLLSIKNPPLRQRLAERLGIFNLPEKPHKNGIWIHAVSLGESVAAIAIIKKLLSQDASIPITMTCTTLTGSARITASFSNEIFHVYLPYDLSWFVNKFLHKIQPKIAIFMETEIWPVVLEACLQKNIPCCIANARLSPHSYRGYKKLGFLMPSLLSRLQLIAAQSELDATRYRDLGARPGIVEVFGNVKFDVQIPSNVMVEKEKLANLLQSSTRKCWIAASTHEGEEEYILAAHKQILSMIPNALLIIVPRHPERFSRVHDLIIKHGFTSAKRSQGGTISLNTTVFLGDTMGELSLMYSVSQLAFIGGSLVPVGGHNSLEAAALGVPLIIGPHIFNCIEVTRLLKEAGALQQIATAEALTPAVLSWFQDEEARLIAGSAGLQVLAQNQGAIQKTINWVFKILSLP